MGSSLQLLLFSSAFIVLVPNNHCVCRQSYMTMCNNFEDVDRYSDADNWREVFVGKTQSAKFRRGFSSVDLSNFITKFKELEVLMIIERINRLEQSTKKIRNCKSSVKLEFLNLYGNELKRIEKLQFPNIYITKLHLVNNKIEEIKKGAFHNHRIKVLDISNNLLSFIGRGSLPATTSTKILTIKSNRLTKIEPRSLPPNLSILNLDRNYLRNLTGVLENLKYLETLTLSHNDFILSPNITHLQRLKILDMSFNSILIIKNSFFKETNNLEILDFSYNQLSDPQILTHFVNQTRKNMLTVSVIFNRLKTVNSIDVKRSDMLGFLSYGNPWNCSEWKRIGNKLLAYENNCGLLFYSSGMTPYCIDYDETNTFDSDKYSKRFYDSIKRKRHLIGCNLKPEKSRCGSLQ